MSWNQWHDKAQSCSISYAFNQYCTCTSFLTVMDLNKPAPWDYTTKQIPVSINNACRRLSSAWWEGIGWHNKAADGHWSHAGSLAPKAFDVHATSNRSSWYFNRPSSCRQWPYNAIPLFTQVVRLLADTMPLQKRMNTCRHDYGFSSDRVLLYYSAWSFWGCDLN